MKILVADDTRSLALLLAARLRDMGHGVLTAHDGEAAVELFRTQAPDLVLMDIEMPRLDGFAATRRIRALEAERQWAWTPIIFLTAHDSLDYLVQAIEAGGDDYLTKNAHEQVLAAKMQAMDRIARMRRQLLEAHQRMQTMANQDGLTGLANRRHMDRQVDLGWQACVESKRPYGLLLIDVDHFKRYNDHYGHQAGDECLRRVATRLGEQVKGLAPALERFEPFAARYGGEEFALVLPSMDNGALRSIAQQVCEAVPALQIEHAPNQPWGRVTVSVGGAWMPSAQGHVAQLFRLADARLYEAKAQGRNRAIVG